MPPPLQMHPLHQEGTADANQKSQQQQTYRPERKAIRRKGRHVIRRADEGPFKGHADGPAGQDAQKSQD